MFKRRYVWGKILSRHVRRNLIDGFVGALTCISNYIDWSIKVIHRLA